MSDLAAHAARQMAEVPVKAAVLLGNLRGILDELEEVLAKGSKPRVGMTWLDRLHSSQGYLERTLEIAAKDVSMVAADWM